MSLYDGLTEPVTCSTCKGVSVNGGTLHCHGCYKKLEARLLKAERVVEAAKTVIAYYPGEWVELEEALSDYKGK